MVRILRFRSANRDIFEAIRNGRKKVETRAATERFRSIKAGDTIVFVCGKLKFEKKVKSTKIFKSVEAILKRYKPFQINPDTKTEKEIRTMYDSFHGYREKIKKYGLIAFEFR